MGAEATPPEAVGPTGPPGPPSLEDRVASLETRLDEVIRSFNAWAEEVSKSVNDLADSIADIVNGKTRIAPPPVLTAEETYAANLRAREEAERELAETADAHQEPT